VQPAAPASTQQPAEIQRPRSTADDVRSGDSFKLEAEPAASVVPPQPVVQPFEPFKFPSPKPSVAHQRPAPPKTRSYEAEEAEEDDEEEIVEKAPPRRRPENRRRREARPGSDFLKKLQSGVSALIASIRDKMASLASSEDEEDSRIKRRYLLSGIAVFAVLVVIFIIAGQKSSDPEAEADDPAVELADDSDEAVPAGPVEIVRVMPPPKVFAK
jgi:hypothetical protein